MKNAPVEKCLRGNIILRPPGDTWAYPPPPPPPSPMYRHTTLISQYTTTMRFHHGSPKGSISPSIIFVFRSSDDFPACNEGVEMPPHDERNPKQYQTAYAHKTVGETTRSQGRWEKKVRRVRNRIPAGQQNTAAMGANKQTGLSTFVRFRHDRRNKKINTNRTVHWCSPEPRQHSCTRQNGDSSRIPSREGQK